MSTKIESYKVELDYKNLPGKVGVTTVQLSAQTGSVATVRSDMAMLNKDVQGICAAAAMNLTRELQRYLFKARTEPDATITITGATSSGGSSLEFNGYLAAPGVQQYYGNFAPTVNFVGEAAACDNLYLSFYKATNEDDLRSALPQLNGDGAEAMDSVEVGDMADMIKDVFNIIVESIGDTVADAVSEETIKIINARHKANTAIKKTFLEILENSKDLKFEHWDLIKERHDMKWQIIERIRAALQQPTASFWSSFSALLAEFSLIYVPEFDGVGFLKKSSDRFTDDPESMEIAPISMRMDCGNSSVLPVTQVVVQGPMEDDLRPEDEATQVQHNRTHTLVAWPKDLDDKLGMVINIPAPFWFDLKTHPDAYEKPTEESEGDPDKPDLDPTNYKEEKTTDRQKRKQTTKKVVNILEEWAELRFNEMKYADSTASITLPMDLNLRPGSRYEFTIAGTSSKFTGYMHGVSHALQLSPDGNSCSFSSSIYVTHIKF